MPLYPHVHIPEKHTHTPPPPLVGPPHTTPCPTFPEEAERGVCTPHFVSLKTLTGFGSGYPSSVTTTTCLHRLFCLLPRFQATFYTHTAFCYRKEKRTDNACAGVMSAFRTRDTLRHCLAAHCHHRRLTPVAAAATPLRARTRFTRFYLPVNTTLPLAPLPPYAAPFRAPTRLGDVYGHYIPEHIPATHCCTGYLRPICAPTLL